MKKKVQLASTRSRVYARLIDLIVVLIISLVVMLAIFNDSLSKELNLQRWQVGFILALLWLLYPTYFALIPAVFKGFTFGNWLLKIRLVTIKKSRFKIHLFLLKDSLTIYSFLIPASFALIYILMANDINQAWRTIFLDYTSNFQYASLIFKIGTTICFISSACIFTIMCINQERLSVHDRWSKTAVIDITIREVVKVPEVANIEKDLENFPGLIDLEEIDKIL